MFFRSDSLQMKTMLGRAISCSSSVLFVFLFYLLSGTSGAQVKDGCQFKLRVKMPLTCWIPFQFKFRSTSASVKFNWLQVEIVGHLNAQMADMVGGVVETVGEEPEPESEDFPEQREEEEEELTKVSWNNTLYWKRWRIRKTLLLKTAAWV